MTTAIDAYKSIGIDPEELLAAGTRALTADGDRVASRRWFDRAYRAAEAVGDASTMASAALGYGGLRVYEHRTSPGSALLQSRLRHALRLVGADSPAGLRLRARLAAETDYRTGGHDAILRVLGEARDSPDPVTRMEALSLAHQCLPGPGHGWTRRDLVAEMLALSALTGRDGDLPMSMLWLLIDLLLDADRHAHRRLEELKDLVAQNDHLVAGYVVSVIEVMLAVRAGRLDDAESLAHAAAAHGTVVGDADATGWHANQLVAIRWYQGRVAELRPMLDGVVGSPELSPTDDSHLAALAVAAAQGGDRHTAARVLARLTSRDLARLPRSDTWPATMWGVVEAASLLDDADTARQAYPLLEPFAHLPVMAGPAVVCFGSVQHALGVAALTAGDHDQAVRHLRAAVNDNQALGHWPAVADSQRRLAQATGRRAPHHERAGTVHEPAATCTREGRRWRIDLGERSVHVEHCVGMLHLAVLLANPRHEIAAVELAAGVAALDTAATVGTSAQPVLDQVAVQQYRRRLSSLDAALAESRSSGRADRAGKAGGADRAGKAGGADRAGKGGSADRADRAGGADRAAPARAEREWLMAQLGTATGISGRIRSFSDSHERARVAVGKAIRRAVDRVQQADAAIGDHLHRNVRTGRHCVYRPPQR